MRMRARARVKSSVKCNDAFECVCFDGAGVLYRSVFKTLIRFSLSSPQFSRAHKHTQQQNEDLAVAFESLCMQLGSSQFLVNTEYRADNVDHVTLVNKVRERES